MAYLGGMFTQNAYFKLSSESDFNDNYSVGHVMNNSIDNSTVVEAYTGIYFLTYIVFVVGVLITALTIVGNVLVIIAVISEKRLRKVGNVFIINLAISDCLVGAVVSPLAITYDITGKWVLGEFACDVWISMDVVCCTASILNLCAIAYDRFKAIVEPMKYSRKRTFSRAAIVIMFVWIYSICIAFPRHIGWRKESELHLPDGECVISRELGYTFYSTFGAFFIPLMFMLYFYYQIYCATCVRRSQWHINPGHRAFIGHAFAGKEQRKPTCSEKKKLEMPNPHHDQPAQPKIENTIPFQKTDSICIDDVEETDARRESIEPELLAIYQMRHRSNRIFSNATVASSSTYYSSTDSSNTATTSFSESSDRGSFRCGDGSGRDRLSSTSTEGSQYYSGSEMGLRRHSTFRSQRLSCARQSSLHTEVIHEVASAMKFDNSDESEQDDADKPQTTSRPIETARKPSENQDTDDMNDNADTSDEEEQRKPKPVRKLRSSTFRRRNSRKSKRIAISQEKRAAKTLGIVMGCFIFCWFPFFTVALLRGICDNCLFPPILLQVVCWLGYFNSACNPFIYTFFNSDFKKAFQKMSRCLLPRRDMTYV